ncbi:MAG: hypothetical protein HFI70_11215 [Lachnospiraceae bacterium]|nr:hypothetical protein [Lachnospiraceae bacterium]
MGKYNLNLQGDEIDEITLNKHGDKILISGDDANLWDKFCQGYKKIEEMADEVPKKMDELEKKYPGADNEISSKQIVETSRVRVEFCENAIAVIDNIFGEGTAKKSFRDYYESIPDFLPDEDKFIAFFETMTPIMEDIFKRKIERSQKESKRRMAKYQPQDHKRKGGR